MLLSTNASVTSVKLKRPNSSSSQKCFLNVQDLASAGLQVGGYASINTTSGLNYVCQVFALPVQCSVEADLNETVSFPNKNSRSFLPCRKEGIKVTGMAALSPRSASLVTVTLVQGKKAMPLQAAQPHWVRTLLKPYGVVENSRLDLSEAPLAKLLGISSVIIHCIDSLSEREVAFVNGKTRIQVREMKQLNEFLLEQETTIERECSLQKDQLKDLLIDTFQRAFKGKEMLEKGDLIGPKGILIHDPGSCLRRAQIYLASKASSALLVELHTCDILSASPGESENGLKEKLMQTWNSASKDKRRILWIYHIDSLFPYPSPNGTYRRLLSVFKRFLRENQTGLLVVGVTSNLGDLHPQLKQSGYLEKQLTIRNPTMTERSEYLSSLVPTHCLDIDLVAKGLDYVAVRTPGFSHQDLNLWWREAVFSCLFRSSWTDISPEHPFQITLEDIKESLLRYCTLTSRKSSPFSVEVRPISWSDIGGMEKVKARVRRCVEWPLSHGDSFKRLGLCPPKGILLFGPPGCCKTTVARALVNTAHATFLSASSAQIFSPFVGDSSKAILEIFSQARACAPSVIFLDEIESLVGSRSFQGTQTTKGTQEQVLSTLLNEMDGIGLSDINGNSLDQHVLVVGATNRLDLLDPALLRPGRFDIILYVGNPNQMERKSILETITRFMPVEGLDFKTLAERTELFSGADLKNLCQEAALVSLEKNFSSEKIVWEDMLTALGRVKPSLSKEQLKRYQDLCQYTAT